MQIVDLRQVHSKTLDVFVHEEARRWRDELHWDYRPSIDLIRKFIDSRSLNGFLALDNGRPAGYGFYVLEDHKGLIGGLFCSSDYAQSPIPGEILTEMLASLRATPRLERIEAQLMPFGIEFDPAFLSKHLRLHTRQFMLLKLSEATLNRSPISNGLRIEPWTERAFESAAKLIQLSSP